MFAAIKMNSYRSKFLNNNPFLLMYKFFNDLSTKVDYSSSYFVGKKEIINYLNLTTQQYTNYQTNR